MRWVRFESKRGDGAAYGEVEGEEVRAGSRRLPLAEVRLLAPCEPTKIVCVARNYAAHAAELGNEVPDRPSLFLKPPSAVIGPEMTIELPKGANVDFEAELAVVIKERCRNVAADESQRVILGYTCMNDVSNRTAQAWERNWVRAKAFDTSAPLGPWIVPAGELPWPLRVTCRVNGAMRQDGTTDALIFGIPELVETISSFMTLEPGDVIATGTPAGVGALSAGDCIEVEIGGIGTLRNWAAASDELEVEG